MLVLSSPGKQRRYGVDPQDLSAQATSGKGGPVDSQPQKVVRTVLL